MFTFHIDEITDTIPQAAYILKPFIRKYFTDKKVSDASLSDRRIYLVAFMHELERELDDYLVDWEDFK